MKQDDHKSNHKILSFLRPSRPITLKVDITDLKCRICCNAFDNIENIAAHLSIEHRISGLNISHDLGVRPFKIYNGVNSCIFCSEKFVTVRALSRHTQIHYFNNSCETCGKSFTNSGSLKVHTKFAHLGSKTWCQKCKMVFDSSEEKQRHLAESKRCWQYTCHVCGEKFMSLSLKAEHLQVEHNISGHYACPECSEVFTNKTKRQNHFLTAHTDKFKCSCCHKTFPTNYSLVNHSVMHSSEKKFQCKVCLKEFSRKKNLKQHMPIHMADKPYKCETCHKQFNYRVSWKTHMLSYHTEAKKSKT